MVNEGLGSLLILPLYHFSIVVWVHFFTLSSVENYAPHLTFVDVQWLQLFSVVFGWSTVLIIYWFSVFLCCPSLVLWLGGIKLVLVLFVLSVLIGIYSLAATSTPNVGYIRQKENPGNWSPQFLWSHVLACLLLF